MFNSKKQTICYFVYIAVLCFAGPQSATSQTPASKSVDQDNTLKVLLNEVRLLRLALERNNQSQITLERFRAQQEQVDRTSRDLEDVRKEISELRFSPTHMQEQLEEVEKKVEAGVADSLQYKVLKAEMEQQGQREQRLRDRESYVSAQLAKEQAKLASLSEQLDALERFLQDKEGDQRKVGKGERKKKEQ